MIELLRQLVPELGNELKVRKLKLACAESCTGGGLAYWLTSVAGSSAWFDRGFVTYSNEAKIDLIGVKSSTLDQHGAVSSETALEMAEGTLKNSNADISIAITGIAGPDGGSKEKPVGTVFIACATKDHYINVERYNFAGDRQQIRLQAMATAVETLLDITRR